MDDNQIPTRKFSVEPILCIVTFGRIIAEAPFQAFVLRRVCQHNPEIPYTWCDSLADHPEAEEMVHPKAAILFMSNSLLEALIPAAISFWGGAWGDRTRCRKPLVIVPICGFALQYAIQCILMGFPSLPVEYFLLATLPVAFSGGWTTFFGTLICIVGDETEGDGKLRTVRLGFLQAFYIIGFLPGNLTSSPMLRLLDYDGIIIFSGFVCFLALILALCIIRNSPSPHQPSGEGRENDVHLLKEILQTIVKERPNGQRTCLILSICALATSIIAFDGEANLRFLFTRKQFRWTILEFTVYRSLVTGIMMLGTLFVVTVMSHKMKLEDAPLVATAYMLTCISSIINAFATETWMMYVGAVVGVFHGVGTPLLRSVMSKSVPQGELGKAFSITASLEALIPLAAAPLYTLLYNITLHSFPGAFYLLSALIFIIDTVIVSFIHATYQKYSDPEREPLLNGEDRTQEVHD